MNPLQFSQQGLLWRELTLLNKSGYVSFHPLHATKALRVSRGIALLFLDHGNRRGEWSAPLPGRLYPRERTGTHFTRAWVGPRVGLDRRKISSPPGFDPRTVQPSIKSPLIKINFSILSKTPPRKQHPHHVPQNGAPIERNTYLMSLTLRILHVPQ
jgi:hypothetical protein